MKIKSSVLEFKNSSLPLPKLSIIGKTFLVLFPLLCVLCSCTKFTISLSEQQLQEEINKKFPVQKSYLSTFNVTFREPKVKLEEGSDRLNFSFVSQLDGTRLTRQTFDGLVEISGKITYVPETGELYFTDPVIHTFKFSYMPEMFSQQVNEILTLGVTELLNRIPIYKLGSKNTNEAVAKFIIKEVKVKDKHLHIVLGL
mgnify:CR=1 FL=1